MGKNIISIAFFCIFCILSCQEKLYLKEKISEKNVSITINNQKNNDSLALIIPIEFAMNLRSTKINFVQLYYIYNNKLGSQPTDFVVINNENGKMLPTFDKYGYTNYPKSLTLLNKVNISKDYANQLIKKYNSKKNLSNIKNHKDTVQLIPYSIFRKENTQLLNELRKKPDSLLLNLKSLKEKSILLKEKINW